MARGAAPFGALPSQAVYRTGGRRMLSTPDPTASRIPVCCLGIAYALLRTWRNPGLSATHREVVELRHATDRFPGGRPGGAGVDAGGRGRSDARVLPVPGGLQLLELGRGGRRPGQRL